MLEYWNGILQFGNSIILEHWKVGKFEYWNIGMLDYWHIGTLEYWNITRIECSDTMTL